MKPRPNVGVLAFFSAREKDGVPVYVSVLTFGEMQRGIWHAHHHRDLARAIRLARQLRALRNKYRTMTVGVDYRASKIWAGLCIPSSHNPVDKLLAATAIERNFIVLTRNVRDFDRTKVKVVNPFDDPDALCHGMTYRRPLGRSGRSPRAPSQFGLEASHFGSRRRWGLSRLGVSTSGSLPCLSYPKTSLAAAR